MKKQQEDKRIIVIAQSVINNFIADWRIYPFEYNTEIDIQAEIYSRLVQKLREENLLTFMAKYDVCLESHRNECQRYRRVCCEYPTFYYKNKERKRCNPDIIVYCDPDDSNNPVDKNMKEEINLPMLLVCEIKYETEWGGDFHPEHREKDVRELECLLRQRTDMTINGTEYALFLDFARKREVSNQEIIVSLEKDKVSDHRKIIPFPWKMDKNN